MTRLCLSGLDGSRVWRVSTPGDDRQAGREFSDTADQFFAAHPETASLSIVSPAFAASWGNGMEAGASCLHASTAALPTCFLNDGVADLIGLRRNAVELSLEELSELLQAATLRGLRHIWMITSQVGAASAVVPTGPTERMVLAAFGDDALPGGQQRPIALGIDAAWLLDGESGAQVFVFELLKAMAASAAIDSIVLLSDSGVTPAALSGISKVTGRSWVDAIAHRVRLDVLHRPYQPGADVDLDRYRAVARSVAITVLDFIAYDNPAYHESPFAFRSYQRVFDEKVCQADQVFALSRYIGDRLQRQFAHRLIAPVRSIHLGTDHLDAIASSVGETAAPLPGLAARRFLLVLGNDFAHKNRDFAVKVFAEMCRRGYAGSLVLAGFHLDAGSSFAYELAAVDDMAGRIRRIGPVAPDQKAWLLQHAEAVLYPTSSEGFGLIPFEAAAFGTPTAFVRFGPLAETLPDVPASASWRVSEFADHLFALIANPSAFVAGVNAARQVLTWERCAAETIAAYRDLLREQSPWHAALGAPTGPGPLTRFNETTTELLRRVGRRIRRLSPRSRPQG